MTQQTLGASRLTGQSMVALDLETVSPALAAGERPDFDDPGDFELLAVAMAVQRPGTGPETEPDESTVVFREDPSADAERALGTQLLDRLEALAPDVLVTFNGERFDLPVATGRLRRRGEDEAADRLASLFDDIEHLDLKHSAWAAYGEYTSLTTLIDEQGLPVPRTAWADFPVELPGFADIEAQAKGPYIGGADIAAVGELYLESRTAGHDVDRLEAMLREYAAGDVDRLCQLAARHPF